MNALVPLPVAAASISSRAVLAQRIAASLRERGANAKAMRAASARFNPLATPAPTVHIEAIWSDRDRRGRRWIRELLPHFSPRSPALIAPLLAPDLNPIERVFAKLKQLFRKAPPRDVEAIWRKVGPTPRPLQSRRARDLPRQLWLWFRLVSRALASAATAAATAHVWPATRNAHLVAAVPAAVASASAATATPGVVATAPATPLLGP
jgi:transposase